MPLYVLYGSKRAMESKNFFDDVYDVVRQIPEGRATSYGAIATFLGTKLTARMVGWAMNACHGMPDVPAHRVVNRDGMLTGKHFFWNAYGYARTAGAGRCESEK